MRELRSVVAIQRPTTGLTRCEMRYSTKAAARAAGKMLAAARRLARHHRVETEEQGSASALHEPPTSRLKASLARSLDDSTEIGMQRANAFLKLSSLVGASLRKAHYLRMVDLHERYKMHDPCEMRPNPSRSPSPDSERKPGGHERAAAADLCEKLHWTLLNSGFKLCSHEDEQRALQGHFGDEQVMHAWHKCVVKRPSCTALRTALVEMWTLACLHADVECARQHVVGQAGLVHCRRR